MGRQDPIRSLVGPAIAFALLAGPDLAGASHAVGTWRQTSHGGCCEGYLVTSDTASYLVVPFCGGCDNAIKRSDDRGHSWVQVYPPAGVMSPPGGWGIEGDVQAFRDELLYFGLKPFPRPGGNGIFARSPDRGATWPTVVNAPINAPNLDQTWLYLGPRALACPGNYGLAMWGRTGPGLAFSCNRGDTWTVSPFVSAGPLSVGTLKLFPGAVANGACMNDALRRYAGVSANPWPSESKFTFIEQNYTRAGRHGHWNTDGRFYWVELTRLWEQQSYWWSFGSFTKSRDILLMCRTADLGQTWAGRLHLISPPAIPNINEAWIGADLFGVLYVHFMDKLWVSLDNGATFFRKIDLPMWGDAGAGAVGDAAAAWFSTLRGEGVQLGFRVRQQTRTAPIPTCADADGCMVWGKVTNLFTTASPSITYEMVDSSLDTSRLDFVTMAVQPPRTELGDGTAHIAYTDATGVVVASRGTAP